jgi:Cellulase (glycosyl hydrolase family 5)
LSWVRGSRVRTALGAILPIALAAVVAVAIATDRGSGRVDQPSFGYNDDWEHLAKNPDPANDPFQLAEDGGANVVRYPLQWEAVQNYDPSSPSGVGPFHFTAPDATYGALIRRGIHPIIDVIGAPNGAPSSMAKTCDSSAPAQTPILNQGYPGVLARWEAYVKAVADHYPEAMGIEIWNEENAPPFWGGCAADPDQYVTLLKYAYDGVKASSSPDIPIVLGGPSPGRAADIPGKIEWTDFLRDVVVEMRSRYGRLLVDAVSLHPYRNDENAADDQPSLPDAFAASAATQVNEARAVLDDNGAGQVPIWVTEVGASTTGGADSPHYAGTTEDESRAALEQDQAEADAKVYATLRDLGVPVVIIYSFNDDLTQPETSWLRGSGVVTPSGPPTRPTQLHRKPAYCDLAAERGLAPTCR